MDRRKFVKTLAVAGGITLIAPRIAEADGHNKEIKGSWKGCLVDLTLCIGCRLCEYACSNANNRDVKPLPSYEDQTVFDKLRRMTNNEYTVVNRFPNSKNPESQIFVKTQCMHCNDAACLSACIVKAFSKEEDGAVRYDPWKCMGCRYCMVACPFQVPSYEYFNALAPQVRKCTLCHHIISKQGGVTACAQICPQDAIVYGPREDLIELAHKRIDAEPEKYINHVYGEHEVGGTSWLYISSEPFENLGFPKLDDRPMPSYSEPIQHGIFKNFIPQIALFTFLGAIMYQFRSRNGNSNSGEQ